MRRRAVVHAFLALCLVVDVYLLYLVIVRGGGINHDSFAYWSVDLADPYTGGIGDVGAYLYSPAVAQVFAVLGRLPWPIFLIAWTALQLACLVFLARGLWPYVLVLPPVLFEVLVGNIHLLLAVAIVLGFRHPWTWALMPLTKVTPGVGLVWFAARREWRSLLIALGVTAGIAAISLVAAPDLWRAWAELIGAHVGSPAPELAMVAVPMALRLPVAVGITIWGAVTDRPWVLPVAVLLTQPAIWITSLSILVGILPLRGEPGRRLAAAAR